MSSRLGIAKCRRIRTTHNGTSLAFGSTQLTDTLSFDNAHYQCPLSGIHCDITR